MKRTIAIILLIVLLASMAMAADKKAPRPDVTFEVSPGIGWRIMIPGYSNANSVSPVASLTSLTNEKISYQYYKVQNGEITIKLKDDTEYTYQLYAKKNWEKVKLRPVGTKKDYKYAVKKGTVKLLGNTMYTPEGGNAPPEGDTAEDIDTKLNLVNNEANYPRITFKIIDEEGYCVERGSLKTKMTDYTLDIKVSQNDCVTSFTLSHLAPGHITSREFTIREVSSDHATFVDDNTGQEYTLLEDGIPIGEQYYYLHIYEALKKELADQTIHLKKKGNYYELLEDKGKNAWVLEWVKSPFIKQRIQDWNFGVVSNTVNIDEEPDTGITVYIEEKNGKPIADFPIFLKNGKYYIYQNYFDALADTPAEIPAEISGPWYSMQEPVQQPDTTPKNAFEVRITFIDEDNKEVLVTEGNTNLVNRDKGKHKNYDVSKISASIDTDDNKCKAGEECVVQWTISSTNDYDDEFKLPNACTLGIYNGGRALDGMRWVVNCDNGGGIGSADENDKFGTGEFTRTITLPENFVGTAEARIYAYKDECGGNFENNVIGAFSPPNDPCNKHKVNWIGEKPLKSIPLYVSIVEDKSEDESILQESVEVITEAVENVAEALSTWLSFPVTRINKYFFSNNEILNNEILNFQSAKEIKVNGKTYVLLETNEIFSIFSDSAYDSSGKKLIVKPTGEESIKIFIPKEEWIEALNAGSQVVPFWINGKISEIEVISDKFKIRSENRIFSATEQTVIKNRALADDVNVVSWSFSRAFMRGFKSENPLSDPTIIITQDSELFAGKWIVGSTLVAESETGFTKDWLPRELDVSFKEMSLPDSKSFHRVGDDWTLEIMSSERVSFISGTRNIFLSAEENEINEQLLNLPELGNVQFVIGGAIKRVYVVPIFTKEYLNERDFLTGNTIKTPPTAAWSTSHPFPKSEFNEFRQKGTDDQGMVDFYSYLADLPNEISTMGQCVDAVSMHFFNMTQGEIRGDYSLYYELPAGDWETWARWVNYCNDWTEKIWLDDEDYDKAYLSEKPFINKLKPGTGVYTHVDSTEDEVEIVSNTQDSQTTDDDVIGMLRGGRFDVDSTAANAQLKEDYRIKFSKHPSNLINDDIYILDTNAISSPGDEYFSEVIEILQGNCYKLKGTFGNKYLQETDCPS